MIRRILSAINMNFYKSRHQKSYSDKQLVKYIVEKNLEYINSDNDVFNLSNIKIFMATASLKMC
jgi:hypothetical protein